MHPASLSACPDPTKTHKGASAQWRSPRPGALTRNVKSRRENYLDCLHAQVSQLIKDFSRLSPLSCFPQ